MVKRIFDLFNKEITNVHNAAFVLGFFTLFAQFVALFRDRLLASSFGAGSELDLYYAAFKIPDIIFVTIASLVSVSVLVPFIIEKSTANSNAEEKKFINNIFSFFLFLMLFVVIIVFIFMPYLSPKLFPGFNANEIETLITLSRIMLLSPILLGVSNIFGAITQVHNRFVLYALAPLFYNIGIVIGIIVFVPKMGVMGLAFGVVLGAVMHLLIQLPGVILSNSFPRISFKFNWGSIRKVLELSIPRTFTLAANQLILIIFFAFASLMTAGSIAVFNFSLNLQSVPLSIIGVSYSLAAFPTLARFYQEKHIEKFLTHIITALRHIIFWSLPVIVYFVVLRAQIIRVVLGGGEFSWQDTRLTAASLALFSVSVVSQGLILLFVRAFYASGKTKIPFILSLVSVAISVLSAGILYELYMKVPEFSLALSSILRIKEIPGGEITTLAIAYSIGNLCHLILLWFVFEKKIGRIWIFVKRTLWHSAIGALIGGLVTYAMLFIVVEHLVTDTLIGIFSQGLIAGIVGIAVNITILHILGNEEQREIIATLKRKIWKTEPIVTDGEVV